MMRLDRYLSQTSHISRREATALIRAGRVAINQTVQRDPGVHVVAGHDAVTLDQARVRPPGHVTLVMHKPAGCISATVSHTHETVLDHVPTGLRHRDLAPIGRLDKDTTGLLLLTTDGGLSHYLTHPKHHVEKAYLATLKAALAAGAEARFQEGVVLGDGTPCRPALLERVGELQVRVTVSEGRFHQIKRMLGAVGGHVVALHRERLGALRLDPGLSPGEVRALTDEEWAALRETLPQERAPSGWTPAPPGSEDS